MQLKLFFSEIEIVLEGQYSRNLKKLSATDLFDTFENIQIIKSCCRREIVSTKKNKNNQHIQRKTLQHSS